MDQDLPARNAPPSPGQYGASPGNADVPKPPETGSSEQPTATDQNNSGDKDTRKVRDLLVFKSPSRPPVVIDRELYTFSVAACLLLSIIVAFFGEWFLILLIWATLFFIIALSKRPPEDVDHKITTEGVISMGHVYLWENLGPFWFTKKGGHDLLHLVQQGYLLGTLLVVVPPDLPLEKLRDTLAKYLPYIETPEKTRADRVTDWFTSKLAQKAKTSPPPAS